MTKGRFITFEGPEGAGKTTQINRLKQFFRDRGRECLVTREPGGTDVAEQLRDIVKHHSGPETIADETEVLLFAASRAQHVRHLIQPALARGAIVICDRFMDSTTAYQGYARGLDLEFIQKLNMFAIDGCLPDLTILLDIHPEEGFQRTSTRQETLSIEDRIESETIAFHKRVRDGFLQIAEKEPDRIKVVAAGQSEKTVHKEIMELISDAFGPF